MIDAIAVLSGVPFSIVRVEMLNRWWPGATLAKWISALAAGIAKYVATIRGRPSDVHQRLGHRCDPEPRTGIRVNRETCRGSGTWLSRLASGSLRGPRRPRSRSEARRPDFDQRELAERPVGTFCDEIEARNTDIARAVGQQTNLAARPYGKMVGHEADLNSGTASPTPVRGPAATSYPQGR